MPFPLCMKMKTILESQQAANGVKTYFFPLGYYLFILLTPPVNSGK